MTVSHHPKKSEPGTPAMDTTGASELLDKVTAALALPTPQPLTVKQRKAATRSRKGMEKVISTLATLSTQHEVSVPKQPTSQMTSNLELISQLDPVKQKLVSILTLVQDNMDNAGSGSWNTASTLYGMLQKVAHRDSQLKTQLAPVKEFFGYRTAAAKKAHPKQKAKKEALKAQQEAAAQATASSSATVPPSAPSAPSLPSASASTTAPVAESNVAISHTP